jgi:predicted phage terminase large subunit-like protein
MDSKEIVDTILRLKQQYGFNILLIGKGALEKAIGPFLREAIRKENKFLHLEAIPEVVDKRMGAQSIRARMRAGGVKFDKSAPWYPEFESELLQFDRGQHDDQVEWLKLATQVMEKKNYPWPNAANVKYPLLTTAAMQFAARAYPALVPGPRLGAGTGYWKR